MHRCAARVRGFHDARRALLHFCPAAISISVALGALLSTVGAHAQVQRNFPQNALRGQVEFGNPPEVWLNGQPTRLSPGSRVRDPNQMVVMSGALIGQKLIVNYVQDGMGQLHEVWILTPAEISRQPWPRTPVEAQAWRFDFGAQTWTKP